MSDSGDTWRVLPSGPIERLEDNLWRVQGELPNAGAIQRVMTVVRLSDGRLVIHNGICMDEQRMQELEAWGTPAFLLVPNGYHRLDAAAYRARYPDVAVFCPSAARARVAKQVAVDGDFASFPEQPELHMEHLRGTGDGEGVLVVRSGRNASLVLNDVLFNMPHRGGVSGFMLRHLTASTGGPTVSRIAKMFFVKDKDALRDHLKRLANTPNLARIIVSHHEVVTDEPAATLERVADAL